MNETNNCETILRRYTNLAATIHLLKEEQITLLDPGTWDDKNDTCFLKRYKCVKEAESLLALCFSLASETYHHWKVFADKQDGVCIEFDKKLLEKDLGKFGKTLTQGQEIFHQQVEYKNIKKIKPQKIEQDKLPFLIRWPFQDENEYRIVYVDKQDEIENQPTDIGLNYN